jgi:hypothetical protein
VELPDTRAELYNLALLFRRLGRHDKAAEVIAQIADNDPETGIENEIHGDTTAPNDLE